MASCFWATWPLVLVLLLCVLRFGAAIKCWECNSKYDDSCGDPFSNYSVALVDCDQRYDDVMHLTEVDGEPPKATLCRKTYQIVSDETRIIRGCGWIPNSGYYAEKECFQKTGTHQIQVYHCACRGDGCNRSSPVTAAALLALLLPLVPAGLAF